MKKKIDQKEFQLINKVQELENQIKKHHVLMDAMRSKNGSAERLIEIQRQMIEDLKKKNSKQNSEPVENDLFILQIFDSAGRYLDETRMRYRPLPGEVLTFDFGDLLLGGEDLRAIPGMKRAKVQITNESYIQSNKSVVIKCSLVLKDDPTHELINNISFN